MKSRRTSLNVIGIIILLVGLGTALLIYRTAENDLRDVLGYEQGNGSVYPPSSNPLLDPKHEKS